MKFDLKAAWKKAGEALAGKPPVNAMSAYDVQHIQRRVRAETAFDVACMDTRAVNGRKNVGLVVPEATAPDVLAKAEDIFLEAAKERGLTLTREKILHYVPGSIGPVSRFVQPPPKTW